MKRRKVEPFSLMNLLGWDVVLQLATLLQFRDLACLMTASKNLLVHFKSPVHLPFKLNMVLISCMSDGNSLYRLRRARCILVHHPDCDPTMLLHGYGTRHCDECGLKHLGLRAVYVPGGTRAVSIVCKGCNKDYLSVCQKNPPDTSMVKLYEAASLFFERRFLERRKKTTGVPFGAAE